MAMVMQIAKEGLLACWIGKKGEGGNGDVKDGRRKESGRREMMGRGPWAD